jgi:U3 small nucleolar RNA-associated protein 19
VVTAAVSLCRAFCRLIAKGEFKKKRKKNGDAEVLIVVWLKDRYKDYVREVCALVNHEDPSAQVNWEPLALQMSVSNEVL